MAKKRMGEGFETHPPFGKKEEGGVSNPHPHLAEKGEGGEVSKLSPLLARREREGSFEPPTFGQKRGGGERFETPPPFGRKKEERG